MTLVMSATAGGDFIDGAAALRAGGTTDQRRDAEIENAIRDLKYGMGSSSGRPPWAAELAAALARLRARPLLA